MAAEPTFTFRGGDVALDFCNTLSTDATDRLTDYGRLVSWARQRGILTAGEARRLLDEAEAHPDAARGVHREALALRDAAFRLFSEIAQQRSGSRQDLQVLNAWLPRALQRLRLAPGKTSYAWEWGGDLGLDEMLFPVVRATADLLTHPERLARVHACASDNCGWLFVDTSKNRSRRWCDMADCGNRAKVRRHYARARSR
jgi:predicted RNA-binding Zn ribbon-like protein